MKGYYSVLAFQSKAQGLPEFTSNFCLQRILEGWRHEFLPSQNCCRPFIPDIILFLLVSFAKICQSPWGVPFFSTATLVVAFLFDWRFASPRQISGRLGCLSSFRLVKMLVFTWLLPWGLVACVQESSGFLFQHESWLSLTLPVLSNG